MAIWQQSYNLIKESIENVYIVYDAMGGNNSVAKGKEFVNEVFELQKEKIKRIMSNQQITNHCTGTAMNLASEHFIKAQNPVSLEHQQVK